MPRMLAPRAASVGGALQVGVARLRAPRGARRPGAAGPGGSGGSARRASRRRHGGRRRRARGGWRRRKRHGSMVRPRWHAVPMSRRSEHSRGRLDTRSSGPASAARRPRRPDRAPGASAPGSRRATRQRAPENAQLAKVAKPASSERSASSRCAMRSPAGQVGIGYADAVAVHPPPAGPDQERAGRPDQPDAEARPARAPGRSRACSSRASWETRSPSRPTETRSACAAGAEASSGARRWPRGRRRARG